MGLRESNYIISGKRWIMIVKYVLRKRNSNQRKATHRKHLFRIICIISALQSFCYFTESVPQYLYD